MIVVVTRDHVGGDTLIRQCLTDCRCQTHRSEIGVDLEGYPRKGGALLGRLVIHLLYYRQPLALADKRKKRWV